MISKKTFKTLKLLRYRRYCPISLLLLLLTLSPATDSYSQDLDQGSHAVQEFQNPNSLWGTALALAVVATLVIVLTIGMIRRRQLQETFRDSLEKYRLLVENQTDLVVKIDNGVNYDSYVVKLDQYNSFVLFNDSSFAEEQAFTNNTFTLDTVSQIEAYTSGDPTKIEIFAASIN